ncbi:hypothetical protein [Streptomyces ipomoeae]|uniref:hypothetical protein n=1 Tax=Streptomyces ipomoeae TaxID=103232 RepID=UPI0011461E00|nr:hypothetical protein [Streptomyces ipomoeae]TQE26562.1 hypothetical protein SipoB123_14115 [Streptomyces ipomoeae]
MAAASAEPESRAAWPESVGRRSLKPSKSEISGARALLSALDSAVVRLGGLGGSVHEHSPSTGRLRLVAASGLTPEIVEAWSDLQVEQDVARHVRYARAPSYRVPGNAF